MRYALAALLLLTGCASEPGWKTASFVAIPRLEGGTCWHKEPAVIWNWVLQYADMVARCAKRSVVTTDQDART